MLILPRELTTFWGIRPRRIIHVGAHTAEDLELYATSQWGRDSTVWVEALPEQIPVLEERVKPFSNHRVVQAVAWELSGEEVEFTVASNIASSSALEFADHSTVYPDIAAVDRVILTTTALGDLDIWTDRRETFLNLDIQGAEISALKGMQKHLDYCVAIYCEVNTRELYRGVPFLSDVDKFMAQVGFRRVDWRIYRKFGWGDALYLPSERFRATSLVRRSLRKLIATRRHRTVQRVWRKAQSVF